MALLDAQVINRPAVERFERWHDLLLKLHFAFVVIWMISAYFVPSFAETIGRTLNPIGKAVTAFFPSAASLFFGTLSATFYQSIVSETLLVSVMLGVFTLVLYVGRYANNPWRLAEFIAERVPVKVLSLGYTVLITLCIGFLLFSLFILPYWIGLTPYPGPAKAIQPHQMALWSIMLSVLPTLIVFLDAILLSYVVFVGRSIFTAPAQDK